MHHALEIDEVLFNIFDHCHEEKTDLAALASTCRTFKEPALDLLWQDLCDLSPLARCLPDASHRASRRQKCYAFSRPLTQTEWDTLQGYTRRIRRIQQAASGLGRKSMRAISEPHTTEPLFQNLRHLRLSYTAKTMPLLRPPFPSIISLAVDFFDICLFQNAITTLSKFPCDLSIRLHALGSMSTNSLVQLSCMTVTRLQFRVDTALAGQVVASHLPHLFPHLLDLTLSSQYLAEISPFLSKIRLPAITVLRACVRNCPSGLDVSSFLASVQISGIGPAFQELSLFQSNTYAPVEVGRILGMQDFRPCMAFKNLRNFHWNTQCRVELIDTDMLTLASAWPRLEQLVINETRGWSTSSGITPYGLVRLLKTCPSLRHVALVLNTRDFVQLPESSESLELSLLPDTSIEILDSPIEVESVPAIAEFFARISPRFNLLTMERDWVQFDPHIRDVYFVRWLDVHRLIEKVVSKHP